MLAEFPIIIVMLTLTGIASHNLYRTLLWQDGADNGFNSAPNEALYAASNYRPYKAPMVWSGLYVIHHTRIQKLANRKQHHQLQPCSRGAEHILPDH
jgi:hypothetical protein